MLKQKKLNELHDKFVIYGDFLVATPFGAGHINDTYQITCDQGGLRVHYIMQRVNSTVFKNPHKVMENIDRVTSHLLNKFRELKLTRQRRTLRLLRTQTGIPYVFDENGECWRAYVFIENARSYNMLQDETMAFAAAYAFGEFQSFLVDLPGGRLNETIPNFHNTPSRIEDLIKSVKNDLSGRAKNVAKEVDFVMARAEECRKLLDLNASGDIPERITHNDTKVNNLLIDDATGQGLCVMDLDTVMPGLSLYDFGDMVRTGATTAEEDYVDLSKVELDFNMFEALLRGFYSSASKFLTPAEVENLPFSGKLITLEIGMRFLSDYIDGDIYFKTKRPDHNLERARNQFKLVESIEGNMDKMQSLLKHL